MNVVAPGQWPSRRTPARKGRSGPHQISRRWITTTSRTAGRRYTPRKSATNEPQAIRDDEGREA